MTGASRVGTAPMHNVNHRLPVDSCAVFNADLAGPPIAAALYALTQPAD